MNPMLDLIADTSLETLREFGFGIAATVVIVVVGIIFAALVADDDSAVIEDSMLGNGAVDPGLSAVTDWEMEMVIINSKGQDQ